MRTLPIIIHLIISNFLLFSFNTVYSQTSKQQFYKTSAGHLFQLRIGDKCPEIEITHIINFKKNRAFISEFRGKGIILDFWATWCLPCISLLPKIDSLQKIFENEILFLPVSYEKEEVVSTMLNKIKNLKGTVLPSVTEDTVLKKLFNFNTYPHYVWIDTGGYIKAITYSNELTKVNLEAFIKGENLNLPIKEYYSPQNIHSNVPIFSQNDFSLKDSALIRYSIVTKYIPGAVSSAGGANNKIMLKNVSILTLFKFAYSEGNFNLLFGDSFIKIYSKDSLKYTYNKNWSEQQITDWHFKNAVCYDLLVPLEDSALKYKIMQQDLEKNFPLKAFKEKVKTKCFIIKQLGNSKDYISKGGKSERITNQYQLKYKNISIRALTLDLLKFYQYKNIQIFNETGYKGNIDIELNTDLHNIQLLNRELNKYNLSIQEETRDLDILVIKDHSN